jgi:hypothetical protein
MVTTEVKVSHKPVQNHQHTICGFNILRVKMEMARMKSVICEKKNTESNNPKLHRKEAAVSWVTFISTTGNT